MSFLLSLYLFLCFFILQDNLVGILFGVFESVNKTQQIDMKAWHNIHIFLLPFALLSYFLSIFPSLISIFQQRRKILRYVGDISPIYSVLESINTIFHGEISVRRNFGRNSQKSTIYRDISTILAINWVNDIQTRYSEVNVLQHRYSA